MLGAPNLSSSVEHTFLLGGWELFLFVWYPKKENAMSDNVAAGVCCVGTERERGKTQYTMLFVC